MKIGYIQQQRKRPQVIQKLKIASESVALNKIGIFAISFIN